MRFSGVLVLASLVIASCLGQTQHNGTGAGYTGIGPTGFGTASGRFGAPTGYGRGYGQGQPNRGSNGRQVLAAPIYVGIPVYGGYGYGWGPDSSSGGPDAAAAPASENPSITINQDFVPDHANPVVRDYPSVPEPSQGGMQSYTAPGPPPGEPALDQTPVSVPDVSTPDDEQPTIYLIAFRDHTIMPAFAYWTEGRTLKYVNMDHGINQATLDLVDRDLSYRLNQERNVDFKLPSHE
jgi:hypothetical protein